MNSLDAKGRMGCPSPLNAYISNLPSTKPTADEQYPQPRIGDRENGTDLQLTFPTVEEQKEAKAEAEAQKASAFVISDAEIDNELCRGTGFEHGKYRVYKFYQEFHMSLCQICKIVCQIRDMPNMPNHMPISHQRL